MGHVICHFFGSCCLQSHRVYLSHVARIIGNWNLAVSGSDSFNEVPEKEKYFMVYTHVSITTWFECNEPCKPPQKYLLGLTAFSRKKNAPGKKISEREGKKLQCHCVKRS